MICKHEIRILFLAALILGGLAVQTVERAEITECLTCRAEAVL